MIIVTAKVGLLSCPSKGQLHQARCPLHHKRESQHHVNGSLESEIVVVFSSPRHPCPSVRAGISLGSSVVIVERPLNSPDLERSCCLASRQSESASPGSAKSAAVFGNEVGSAANLVVRRLGKSCRFGRHWDGCQNRSGCTTAHRKAGHRRLDRRRAYPGTVSLCKRGFLLSVKTVAREALAKIDTGCAITTFTAD